MPSPTTKNRQALKARFVRGAVPTQTDFSDLIGASLNQAEDGVYKLPHEPLSLVRQKPDQPVLRFYEDPASSGSAWQIVLADNNVPGFGIANSNGARLFIDQATGNLGIGTSEPKQALHVNGSAAVKKLYADEVLVAAKLGIGTSEPKQALHVNGSAAVSKLYADEVWIADKKVTTDDPLAGKITVLANGNVGIGTANPDQRLTVDGSVGINGTLTRTVWAKSGNGPAETTWNGRLQSRTLAIRKRQDKTALRVVYCDVFGCSAHKDLLLGFVYYEVRIDGKSLSPALGASIGLTFGGGVNAPGAITGYANGITSGSHQVEIWIKMTDTRMKGGTGGANLTGWPNVGSYFIDSTWTIEVEEVMLAEA